MGVVGSGRHASYKGTTPAHKAERQNILNALTSGPFHLPIPEDVARKALDDHDGDALDALVLLVGAQTRVSAD